MSGRLDERVIVIVGGTSGLGRSAAEACVREGARVVVVGRDVESAESVERALGEHCRSVVGDAREPATAAAAVKTAVDVFGTLSGLYHVAGGSGRRFGDGPLDAISDEGWNETIQWNLTSLFYSNRAAVQQLLRQRTGGVILNMSSVLASAPAPEHFATHAYAAAKAAVLGLTQASAAYYAAHNIRFNALLPGLVDTPMAQRAVQNASIVEYVERRQKLDHGRVGVPQDLDGAVVFLLSEEARFITGQALAIDGGWSVAG